MVYVENTVLGIRIFNGVCRKYSSKKYIIFKKEF